MAARRKIRPSGFTGVTNLNLKEILAPLPAPLKSKAKFIHPPPSGTEFYPKTTRSHHTEMKPFSFDQKDAERFQKKEQKIKELIDEEVKVRVDLNQPGQSNLLQHILISNSTERMYPVDNVRTHFFAHNRWRWNQLKCELYDLLNLMVNKLHILFHTPLERLYFPNFSVFEAISKIG